VPVSWPQIEGVDHRQLERVLGPRPQVFLALLDALLVEFEGLARFELTERLVAQRPLVTAQVHRLRGAAAGVGAFALQALASSAEATLKDPHGSPEAAGALRAQIGSALRAQAVAISALGPPSVETQEGDRAAAPLDRSRLSQLQALLERHDFSALTCVDEWSDGLRALLLHDFAPFRAALSSLRFDEAVLFLRRR
jgi:HPt (histidine-containing phosphotransfer) domain-containing protein